MVTAFTSVDSSQLDNHGDVSHGLESFGHQGHEPDVLEAGETMKQGGGDFLAGPGGKGIQQHSGAASFLDADGHARIRSAKSPSTFFAQGMTTQQLLDRQVQLRVALGITSGTVASSFGLFARLVYKIARRKMAEEEEDDATDSEDAGEAGVESGSEDMDAMAVEEPRPALGRGAVKLFNRPQSTLLPQDAIPAPASDEHSRQDSLPQGAES